MGLGAKIFTSNLVNHTGEARDGEEHGDHVEGPEQAPSGGGVPEGRHEPPLLCTIR